ncbi:hypothetical protein M1M30_gp014 [Maribacter phage Colly_1]|uniref:Uncharacterized protein n=1 Tax=Maribacter phage Colly_1 TaxID=2745691 RepID=A0A8E4UXW1_9CAUD|nr:hypothetical protein M1M30_gp014 [Maribacter phage Colly_1]QQO97240.1 hypothetical protein Colly1_14 [Maribacter phage Colly_1]
MNSVKEILSQYIDQEHLLSKAVSEVTEFYSIKFEDFEFNLFSDEVPVKFYKSGGKSSMEYKKFHKIGIIPQMFMILVKSPEKSLSKVNLIKTIWGSYDRYIDNSFRVQIGFMKKLLKDNNSPWRIDTSKINQIKFTKSNESD